MSVSDHRKRKEQLLDLRNHDPLRVIAMYRRAVGLNRHSMLPAGMDLTSLVDSIVDYEAESGKLAESPI